jgi:hypothetical protein
MKQVIFKSPGSHRLLINKRLQNLVLRIRVSWFLLRAWNMADDNDEDDEDDDDINVIKVQKRCAILYKTINLSNGKNILILLVADFRYFHWFFWGNDIKFIQFHPLRLLFGTKLLYKLRSASVCVCVCARVCVRARYLYPISLFVQCTLICFKECNVLNFLFILRNSSVNTILTAEM